MLRELWDEFVYVWWLHWFVFTLGFAALFLGLILAALLWGR